MNLYLIESLLFGVVWFAIGWMATKIIEEQNHV